MTDADPMRDRGSFDAAKARASDPCGLNPTFSATHTPVHPLLCGRDHPPRRPKYVPGSRPAQRLPASQWGRATIVSAADGGPVRIGMNWARSYDTSTTFCTKSRTAQFFEGPHEQAAFQRMTVDHRCVDLQFQPLELSWPDHPWGSRSYTPDAIELTVDGSLTVHEIKAHPAYFEDPQNADLFDAAELCLSSFPMVRFNRESGHPRLEGLRRRIAKKAFHYRMEDCTAEEVAAAIQVVRAGGGEAPLAAVHAAISPDRTVSERKAYAMLVARDLAFELDVPPQADTPVRLPDANLHPTRLRDFLKLFAPGGSA